jgi:hypothetical protein
MSACGERRACILTYRVFAKQALLLLLLLL